jgi:OmpA family
MRVGLLVLFASVRVAFASAQVAPASVDFGPVDVRGVVVTRTITVTNTTDSGIDLGTSTISGSSAFALTPPPPIHLPAGQSVTATIAYHPTTEEADAATVSIVLLNQPAITIPVQGRGIDRHLVVTPPSTIAAFRNAPLDAAVMIANTGEANLAITSVGLAGDSVWQLVDGDPVDVPGGTTYALHVRFTPVELGAAPLATLRLESNAGSTSIPLVGEGVARDVTLEPDLDLGYVGVGEALEGEVSLVNLDTTNAFTVAKVTTSDTSFELAPPAQLAAGTTTPLQVVFHADAPGDYTTTATLFLDADPVATDTLTIHAHAAYIDAQGGGGCNAGGDAGLGLVILVLLLTRRRVLALLLAPLVANAEPRNLDVSIFDPTPSTVGSSLQLVTPGIGATGDVTVSALLTYAAHPLVLSTPQADDVAIGNRMTLVLGGAWAVSDRIELGAHVPMFVQTSDSVDSQMAAGTPAVRGDGVGNLTVDAKLRLTDELAALASITAPTASGDRFAGQDGTSAHLLAVAGLRVAPRVLVMLNIGGVARPESRFASYIERSGVVWGAGARYAWSDAISVDAELFGELVPGGHIDAMGNASMTATTEALVGASKHIDPWLDVGAAIGRGVTGGPGSPAFRGLVTLTFMPSTPRVVHVAPPPLDDIAAPSHAPAVHHVATGDSDHDGIPDDRDTCPAEPETINGNADDDGCPDAGDSLVAVGPNALELHAPVEFVVGSRLDPGSLNVLGQAAATLRAHPELRTIRVEVHVPASGDAAADLALSQLRADAVRNWLVQWGIAPTRLEALGAGSDNEGSAAEARVELIEVR